MHPQILARALFAIQWHSVPDHLALDHAASLPLAARPEPGTLVRVLWLLKDADGLDRVRITDLDPGQLRYEESVAIRRPRHAELLLEHDGP